jgi:hypothetical protein
MKSPGWRPERDDLCRMPDAGVEAMLGFEVYCHRFIRRCRRRHTTGTAALKVPLPSRASIRQHRRCLRLIS